jgi:hypothetical protein
MGARVAEGTKIAFGRPPRRFLAARTLPGCFFGLMTDGITGGAGSSFNLNRLSSRSFSKTPPWRRAGRRQARHDPEKHPSP